MARRVLPGGPVEGALVGGMLAGCLVLWVGVPLGWLWVGSQLQSSAGLGTALMVAMVGSVASILSLVPALVWMNRKHVELRESRETPVGRHTALEVLMVTSALLAVVAFAVWFLGFSGSSPIPLNLQY